MYRITKSCRLYSSLPWVCLNVFCFLTYRNGIIIDGNIYRWAYKHHEPPKLLIRDTEDEELLTLKQEMEYTKKESAMLDEDRSEIVWYSEQSESSLQSYGKEDNQKQSNWRMRLLYPSESGAADPQEDLKALKLWISKSKKQGKKGDEFTDSKLVISSRSMVSVFENVLPIADKSEVISSILLTASHKKPKLLLRFLAYDNVYFDPQSSVIFTARSDLSQYYPDKGSSWKQQLAGIKFSVWNIESQRRIATEASFGLGEVTPQAGKEKEAHGTLDENKNMLLTLVSKIQESNTKLEISKLRAKEFEHQLYGFCKNSLFSFFGC